MPRRAATPPPQQQAAALAAKLKRLAGAEPQPEPGELGNAAAADPLAPAKQLPAPGLRPCGQHQQHQQHQHQHQHQQHQQQQQQHQQQQQQQQQLAARLELAARQQHAALQQFASLHSLSAVASALRAGAHATPPAGAGCEASCAAEPAGATSERLDQLRRLLAQSGAFAAPAPPGPPLAAAALAHNQTHNHNHGLALSHSLAHLSPPQAAHNGLSGACVVGVAGPALRRRNSRKCRKVYGMEQRALWCTQCRWKKACSRFCDSRGGGRGAAGLRARHELAAHAAHLLGQEQLQGQHQPHQLAQHLNYGGPQPSQQSQQQQQPPPPPQQLPEQVSGQRRGSLQPQHQHHSYLAERHRLRANS